MKNEYANQDGRGIKNEINLLNVFVHSFSNGQVYCKCLGKSHQDPTA